MRHLRMQMSIWIQIQTQKIQPKTLAPSSHDAGIGSMQDLFGQEGGYLAVTEREKGKEPLGTECPPGSIRKLYGIFASALFRYA